MRVVGTYGFKTNVGYALLIILPIYIIAYKIPRLVEYYGKSKNQLSSYVLSATTDPNRYDRIPTSQPHELDYDVFVMFLW